MDRLEVLWAEREIRRVLDDACEGTDRLDAELLRSAYHDDATDDHGAFTGTGHEFAEHIVTALPAAGFTATAHHITNCRIDVDGDRARARSYFLSTAQKGTTDGRSVTILAGRYHDELRLRDGRWAITARRVTIDVQATVSQP